MKVSDEEGPGCRSVVLQNDPSESWLTISASSNGSIHANDVGYPHRDFAYSASFRDVFPMHNAWISNTSSMTFSLKRRRNSHLRGDCGSLLSIMSTIARRIKSTISRL
ncbi:hypothetical protein TNCV_402011 [Trichonephila clavipes]|nr:hypothetical protein TNCV_402011 [Trichonephila clavipes]